MSQFSAFLIEFFTEKQIDASVYESYVISILEEETDESETIEALSDILASLIDESDVPSTVAMLIDRWKASLAGPQKSSLPADAEQPKKEVNLGELMKLKETHINTSSSSRQLTEEQRRIKEQILANYSQTAVPSEELDDDDEAAAAANGDDEDDDLEKNTNKADVNKLAREKREQAKLESQQKKLKDKEDRARQKAAREDKKAKRQSAAVKGERRR